MKHLNSKRVVISIFLLWGLSLFSISAGENDSFQIGNLKVNPGEIKSGYLSVPEKDGIGIRIPLTIINGLKEGKVLALVAGVHGYEYPPILSLYRLKEMIDPQSTSKGEPLFEVGRVKQ